MAQLSSFAHITLLQSCPLGIIKKLNGCASDAYNRGLSIDYYVIVPDHVLSEYEAFPFIKVIGVPVAGNKMRVRWQQFIYLRNLISKYQRVVLRYPGADIGCLLLSNVISRCIGEHHTLFIQEQKKTSLIRAYIEVVLGRWWLKRFYGHIGVTNQILQDVINRSNQRYELEAVLPNPYLFSSQFKEGIFTKKDKYVGVIAANIFAEWHGLDRLLTLFSATTSEQLELWVVGECGVSSNTSNVTFFGKKTHSELSEIYRDADFAINSFGLDRLQMTEGSTLKLREYFDFCLPVVSPLADNALPNDFPYIHIGDQLDDWLSFLDNLNGVAFNLIKQDVIQYLGVEAINDRLVVLCGK